MHDHVGTMYVTSLNVNTQRYRTYVDVNINLHTYIHRYVVDSDRYYRLINNSN